MSIIFSSLRSDHGWIDTFFLAQLTDNKPPNQLCGNFLSALVWAFIWLEDRRLSFQTCPWDPDLRELRAECYIAQGDYFKAIGDIRPTTKLRSDNTAGYYKLSTLYYEMGEAQDSLT